MTWEEYGTQEVAADRKTWCKLVKTLCPMVDEMTDEDMWIGDVFFPIYKLQSFHLKLKLLRLAAKFLRGIYVGK